MHPSYVRLAKVAQETLGTDEPGAMARALGEAAQVVSNWRTRGVSKQGMLRAQEVFGVFPKYLLTGQGPARIPSFVGTGMVREAFRDSGSIAPLVTSSPPREYASPSLEIPLMAAAGSMGDGNDQPDHDIVVRTISIEPAWVSKSFRSVKPDALRFITAYGESMAPTFHDGDVLLVDTHKTVIDIEGVYVLEAHRRLFIKRVRQRITDGAYEISSDNENAKTPDVLNGSHQVSVLGRVVWIWNGRKP